MKRVYYYKTDKVSLIGMSSEQHRVVDYAIHHLIDCYRKMALDFFRIYKDSGKKDRFALETAKSYSREVCLLKSVENVKYTIR